MDELLHKLCVKYNLISAEKEMEDQLQLIFTQLYNKLTNDLRDRVRIEYFYLKAKEMDIYVPLREMKEIIVFRHKTPQHDLDAIKQICGFKRIDHSLNAYFKGLYRHPLTLEQQQIYEKVRATVEDIKDPTMNNRTRFGIMIMILRDQINLRVTAPIRLFLMGKSYRELQYRARKIYSVEPQSIL